MERCVYCGTERGRSFSCCGEVHFEEEEDEEDDFEELVSYVEHFESLQPSEQICKQVK